MSVTTSSATIEPPPLLFGQRSPSPPAFSSHASPNHVISPRSPIAFTSHIEDIDMSTSTTLPPQGQNHDREDLAMDEAEDVIEQQAGASAHPGRNADSVSAGAPEQDDAMDTTPVAPNGRSEEALLSNAPPGDDQGSEPTVAADTSAAEVAEDQAGSTLQADNPISTLALNGAPVSPGDIVVLPPPIGAVPPRVDSPPAHDDGAEDSSSSDEDDDEDDRRHWHKIHEDTSSPDERELKEIEALGETSALDHAYWEKKTFTSLDDPEYSAGPSGRVEWTITNYNGTKENPNKEVLMKSPIVNVGGYDWQIKFYPKGNDSEYLSVYVECVTMAAEKKDPSDTDHDDDNGSQDASIPTPDAEPQTKNAAPPTRTTPLPLLVTEPVPTRPSVAAQVSVVLYNPNEPRVNYSKTCLHRFCPDSPDWGWTRFHGPHYEIHSRHRGQRQALLRNDTLAFTSYIRIIEDETGCLGEHESRDNPWDSFAMTGLQGLMGLEPHGAPGGNLISAVASWMLLKPFRQFLYGVEIPDPVKHARKRPMPVLAALQKILYQMRTQAQPRSGPVDLEDITDALEWYGFDEDITKLDVIQIWDILRSKIDYELSDDVSGISSDSHAVTRQRILELFGARKDISVEASSFRIAVGGGITTMQDAVDSAPALNEPTQQLPQILQIQLERQEFDDKTRTWKKRMDKLQLDDSIQVGTGKSMDASNQTEGAKRTALSIGYTLYGFVAHKEDLQSGLYYPVLRPEGPSGRWYAFQDGKDDYKVICMTRRQALDVHAGSSMSASPVAYVALYVRDEIAQMAFDLENEPAWTPPDWLIEQAKREKEDCEIHAQGSSEPTKVGATEELDQQEPKETEYHVIDSRIFLKHQGPGIIDVFDDAFWTQAIEAGNTTDQKYVHSVMLPSTGSPEDIRKLIARSVGDVDPKRCKLWIMDSRNRSMYRPDFILTDRAAMDADWMAEDLGKQWPERRIWLHLLDPSEVQEPKKDRTETTDDTPMSGTEVEPTSQIVAVEIPIPPPPSTPPPPPMDFDDMDGVLGGLPPPPPPPPAPEVTLDIVTIGETSVEINDVIPPRLLGKYDHDEVYVFIKFFDAETQTYEPRGSFIAHKSDYVDRTVLKRLNLPEDTELRLFEEEEIASTRKLRPHCTFQQSFLYNTTIIIAQPPISPDAATALAVRGAYADPQAYLSALSTARNFPALATGTVTLDHFSAEHYHGGIHNGAPHGTGRKVYFSGDVYEGSFVLGQRHGAGRMVFANGDSYEGEWAHNQQHGTGTFVEAASGNRYVGGWRNDRKFGEGVTYWRKAEEAERLCRICWEEGADAAFYDCGHVVACLGCARRVDNCPVCRRRVLAPVKLYF